MLNKRITFIYSDSIQKQVAEMIAEQARQRGYKIRLTNNKHVKCEIGWYCDHINLPQFSKFSIIMLHDITQQYGYWPDIWMREAWNKYDIGFLPNYIWVDNWNKCSDRYYTNTRKGVYLTGWPKADRISAYINNNKKQELQNKIGVDPNKPTVLYAPAWENDCKQDDFVQAMLPLDVNIVVKQAPWSDEYKEQLRNIHEMYELHKDNPRVKIVDPSVNILDVIMVSDVLVSEESSTMCESVMMGKPAVSVTDWLIPDTTPSRYPSDEYDYVIKTKKDSLTECVEKVLNNYDKYQGDAKKYSETNFPNIGKTISMMLDILDSYVNDTECPYASLVPKNRKRLNIKDKVRHTYHVILREVRWNYCERIALFKCILKVYLRITGKEI